MYSLFGITSNRASLHQVKSLLFQAEKYTHRSKLGFFPCFGRCCRFASIRIILNMHLYFLVILEFIETKQRTIFFFHPIKNVMENMRITFKQRSRDNSEKTENKNSTAKYYFMEMSIFAFAQYLSIESNSLYYWRRSNFSSVIFLPWHFIFHKIRNFQSISFSIEWFSLFLFISMPLRCLDKCENVIDITMFFQFFAVRHNLFALCLWYQSIAFFTILYALAFRIEGFCISKHTHRRQYVEKF